MAATRSIELAKRCKNDVWLFDAVLNRFCSYLNLDRLAEANDDLRVVIELARVLGGVSHSFSAELAQARVLVKQGRSSEGREVLGSIDSRFGSVLSTWDRVLMLHEIGKASVAEQDFKASVVSANSILTLLEISRDCPRGYDSVEWTLNELDVRVPESKPSFNFPPAIYWDVYLIDPSSNKRQLRH
jgi:hypothetical protein